MTVDFQDIPTVDSQPKCLLLAAKAWTYVEVVKFLKIGITALQLCLTALQLGVTAPNLIVTALKLGITP